MPMNLAEAPPSPPFQQKAGRGGVRCASLSLVELAGNAGEFFGTSLLSASHTHAIAILIRSGR